MKNYGQFQQIEIFCKKLAKLPHQTAHHSWATNGTLIWWASHLLRNLIIFKHLNFRKPLKSCRHCTCRMRFGRLRSSSSVICASYLGRSKMGVLSLQSNFDCGECLANVEDRQKVWKRKKVKNWVILEKKFKSDQNLTPDLDQHVGVVLVQVIGGSQT